MNIHKETIKYFLSGLLIIFFLCVGKASAASVILESDQHSYGLDREVRVDVLLDPQGEDINAIDGTILYDPGSLEFKKAEDGQSAITYWLVHPTLASSGAIQFSGVIPGGFSGLLSPYYSGTHPGKMLSLFFRSKKSGPSDIRIGNISLLQNDGKGTPLSVTSNSITFSISSTTGSFILDQPADASSPDEFRPEISRSPLIFGGKWFVIFDTTDQGSGINHYEIDESRKETPDDNWQIAESPYELKDQGRRSNIFIKAVDNAGNEKIETLSPSPVAGSSSSLIKISLVLVLLLIIALFRHFYGKKKQ